MSAWRVWVSLVLLIASGVTQEAYAAERFDKAPRIAVISAFEPEWQTLIKRLESPKSYKFNGVSFVTGTMEDRDVVLMMSGVSMVNAAMNTQALIDHFHVKSIVFSGIAGGIDPSLKVGDVVVPQRWAQSLETIMARETAKGFEKPGWLWHAPDMPGYGMIYPNTVIVGNAKDEPAPRIWFEADADMLKIAAGLPATTLKSCTEAQKCLDHQPKLLVGGEGVSSPAFVDNAAYRDYIFATFKARVTDMESAAVGQVAYANGVPFIVFRSLSDLAGGDTEVNQMATFMSLASENSAHVVSLFIRALPKSAN